MEEKETQLNMPLLLGVLVKPFIAMKKAVEKPIIWLPLLITMAASTLQVLLNTDLYSAQLTEALHMTMGDTLATVDLPSLVMMQLIISVITFAVMIPITWIIYTLIMYVVIGFFGGDRTMKQLCSITANAMYIKVLFLIIGAVLIMVTQNLNAASVFGLNSIIPVTDPIILTILSLITINRIWEYAVTAMGIHNMSGLSKGKCTAIMVVMFILLVIFQVGVLISSMKMLQEMGM